MFCGVFDPNVLNDIVFVFMFLIFCLARVFVCMCEGVNTSESKYFSLSFINATDFTLSLLCDTGCDNCWLLNVAMRLYDCAKHSDDTPYNSTSTSPVDESATSVHSALSTAESEKQAKREKFASFYAPSSSSSSSSGNRLAARLNNKLVREKQQKEHNAHVNRMLGVREDVGESNLLETKWSLYAQPIEKGCLGPAVKVDSTSSSSSLLSSLLPRQAAAPPTNPSYYLLQFHLNATDVSIQEAQRKGQVRPQQQPYALRWSPLLLFMAGRVCALHALCAFS
jgi:hypothetical protein